jgi:O-antigen/teichoic acid export membrane protein
MEIRNSLLFRNTALNLIGLVIPLAVGFVTIPFLVRSLGGQRFGILALVWVVFGYFGLFDLGLGRTTTKYVAEALGRGEMEKLPGYLWTATLLQTAIGAAGTLLLVATAPFITGHLLNIPPEFVRETTWTLKLVGWSLPIMFLTSSFRGVLEAGQRFDLVNAVKVPVNVLFYVLPLLGVALGYKLPGIVVLLMLSRAAALVVWAGLSLRVFPVLRASPRLHRRLVRQLVSFSGWLALSSVLYAITSSIDRLLIGALLTVTAVTYYSAPYEALNRLGVIPGSLAMVLFPAFSSLDAGNMKDKVEDLFARSVKFLLLSTGPVLVLLMFFAKDFLRLWLGKDFAQTSTLAVQILAAGFLINSVIAVPNNYLLGIGRVDIAPKYQAVELMAYAALTWAGAKLWGITGVALASALRLAAFSLFLFGASFKAGKINFPFFWKAGASKVLLALGIFAAGLWLNTLAGFSIWGAGILTAGFLFVAYFRLLETPEREFLRARVRFRRGPGRETAAGPGSSR